MDQKIWEYPLRISDNPTVVETRAGARFLTVRSNLEDPKYYDRDITLYALIDRDQPKEKRTVVIVGGSHPIPNDLPADAYLGTVYAQWRDGGESYVGLKHVFVLPPDLTLVS